MAGNVDDLELAADPEGGPPTVVAILSGAGALARRIGGRPGRALEALEDARLAVFRALLDERHQRLGDLADGLVELGLAGMTRDQILHERLDFTTGVAGGLHVHAAPLRRRHRTRGQRGFEGSRESPHILAPIGRGPRPPCRVTSG